MRHDPASGAIIIMLRSLKMYGLAQAATDLMEQGAPEPPRVYRRAKLSENCSLWNMH